jgi:perosamine synthetase
LDQFIQRRTEQAATYNREFAGRDDVELPPDRPGCRHAWHLYILRLNLDRLRIGRDEFVRCLRQKGVCTSIHFIPIPLHSFFARSPVAGYSCPRATELYPRIVSLPLYPGLTDEQLHYVAQSVREVLDLARLPRFLAASPLQSELSAVPREASPEGLL